MQDIAERLCQGFVEHSKILESDDAEPQKVPESPVLEPPALELSMLIPEPVTELSKINGKADSTVDTDVDVLEYVSSPFPETVSAFKKPTPKKAQKPLTLIKLNSEHEDTFLKVFRFREYISINLRALVNLAQALGGTISTTGGNRCRIELNNIYAYALMSELPSGVDTPVSCKKATITMHGGGHRRTRSQNHDRGTTPDYLIRQFRSAFERAGYTPERLGVVNDDNLNPSPISLTSSHPT